MFTQWYKDDQKKDDPIDTNKPKDAVEQHPEPMLPTISLKPRLKKTPTKWIKCKSSRGCEFLTPGIETKSEREETILDMGNNKPICNEVPVKESSYFEDSSVVMETGPRGT